MAIQIASLARYLRRIGTQKFFRGAWQHVYAPAYNFESYHFLASESMPVWRRVCILTATQKRFCSLYFYLLNLFSRSTSCLLMRLVWCVLAASRSAGMRWSGSAQVFQISSGRCTTWIGSEVSSVPPCGRFLRWSTFRQPWQIPRRRSAT